MMRSTLGAICLSLILGLVVACGSGSGSPSGTPTGASVGEATQPILHLPEGDTTEEQARTVWRALMGFPGACDPYLDKTDAEVLQAIKDGYAKEDPGAHTQEADDASLLRLGQIYREECAAQ